MKKIRLVQKFGGNTALESVSFVGWVGGGWYPFFRLHSGSEVSIYPSYARETSLRSEKKSGGTKQSGGKKSRGKKRVGVKKKVG